MLFSSSVRVVTLGSVCLYFELVSLLLSTDVIGHHATIRGGAGHYGLATVNGPELKAPLSLHLNHTHSVYVAVGILVSAITVAVIVVHNNSRS